MSAITRELLDDINEQLERITGGASTSSLKGDHVDAIAGENWTPRRPGCVIVRDGCCADYVFDDPVELAIALRKTDSHEQWWTHVPQHKECV
jgi:hypothetical protein